ncbi:hypothetical protein [Phycicoccus sp. Soil802]|uniref:hypothetical protein n=1 Tax=Phycicoccus sp. Soil802 TaxID=1736414 RepID=UPI00070261FA|nr:hypothetical protein [Phycicoccus sp. Soil802]KRF28350.1 hypothetical protein ASG91_07720 [Phycicoccus sp. Soil802]
MFGSDEPIPTVIEAVVRLVLLVVRSVFRLGRFAIRRPRVASAAVSLVALDRWSAGPSETSGPGRISTG